MSDLISRQSAIDAIDKILPADPMRNDYTQGITCGAALAAEYIKQLPPAQPVPIKLHFGHELTEEEIKNLKHIVADSPLIITPPEHPAINWYDIRHLALIADILRRENLLPERVTEALTDTARVVAILKEEFEEALRKAVEQI